jgi:hypothetical protein
MDQQWMEKYVLFAINWVVCLASNQLKQVLGKKSSLVALAMKYEPDHVSCWVLLNFVSKS